jgi:hypothetical protein
MSQNSKANYIDNINKKIWDSAADKMLDTLVAADTEPKDPNMRFGAR